jgi:hypothetical protein
MNIIFLDSNKEELTTWFNYPHIPNIGDSVVLKILPKTEKDEWVYISELLNNAKTKVFSVKQKQWNEENVLLIVE